MAVYLLHFEPAFKHAGHYLGFAFDVGPRVNAHLHGKGARLTQVAVDAGCTLVLVRVWEDGDRRLERRLKNRHGSAPLCPICRGETMQLPLWNWMPAVASDNYEDLFMPPQDDVDQGMPDFFDFEPQEECIEDDYEWIRQGC